MDHTDYKLADAKGRVTLGKAFANKHVIIKTVRDNTVEVTIGQIVPDHQAWLYKNPKALKMVLRGLEDLKNGKFVRDSDVLKRAQKLVEEMED